MADNMAYAPLVSTKFLESSRPSVMSIIYRRRKKYQNRARVYTFPVFNLHWNWYTFTFSISGNLAKVFIVLFCVAVIALVVVIYLYLDLRKRLQSLPQVGNAHSREENCVSNGSTVRYVTSQANGNKGNRAMNGSPCIERANGSEGNLVENGHTAGIVLGQSTP